MLPRLALATSKTCLRSSTFDCKQVAARFASAAPLVPKPITFEHDPHHDQAQQEIIHKAVISQVRENKSDVVKVAAVDLDGVLRGKYISKEKFFSIADKGLGFCSVIFGWDVTDSLYDHVPYTGFHNGYPDAHAMVDLNSYRTIPWENNTPFFLLSLLDNKGKPLPLCPRQILQKVVKDARDMGYEPLVGVEFEWFNYRETSQSLAAKKYVEPATITPGMFGYSLLRNAQNRDFFTSILSNMEKFGVPIEGLHTETGPGVFEAAIKFGNASQAADRGVLFKASVKELGLPFGILASFMAKPNIQLPGCSGHLHQNLATFERDGKNVFLDKNDALSMSTVFKHYLAGQLALLPELLPFFAPTINSYKRLVDGYWAPTTPTWGVDNRTVAIRVLAGGKATRAEFRVPGADVNPYLAIAASVAAGLHGVRNKLPLPPIVSGNGYLASKERGIARLPRTLAEATEKLAQSKTARELLGAEFIDHYVETRRHEVKMFNEEVTNWEIKRYFEAI